MLCDFADVYLTNSTHFSSFWISRCFYYKKKQTIFNQFLCKRHLGRSVSLLLFPLVLEQRPLLLLRFKPKDLGKGQTGVEVSHPGELESGLRCKVEAFLCSPDGHRVYEHDHNTELVGSGCPWLHEPRRISRAGRLTGTKFLHAPGVFVLEFRRVAVSVLYYCQQTMLPTFSSKKKLAHVCHKMQAL